MIIIVSIAFSSVFILHSSGKLPDPDIVRYNNIDLKKHLYCFHRYFLVSFCRFTCLIMFFTRSIQHVYSPKIGTALTLLTISNLELSILLLILIKASIFSHSFILKPPNYCKVVLQLIIFGLKVKWL